MDENGIEEIAVSNAFDALKERDEDQTPDQKTPEIGSQKKNTKEWVNQSFEGSPPKDPTKDINNENKCISLAKKATKDEKQGDIKIRRGEQSDNQPYNQKNNE